MRETRITRIYWTSRHEPLPVQIEWLRGKFGEIEIVRGRSDNADRIVEDFKRQDCDEMVIVAPLWVIYHVLQRGVKPLWAEMVEVNSDEPADLVYRGRKYRFAGFKRITAIEIKKEEL